MRLGRREKSRAVCVRHRNGLLLQPQLFLTLQSLAHGKYVQQRFPVRRLEK